MKLFSLSNMYIAGIQSGIQTQHSTVRLLNKYRDSSLYDATLCDIVLEWANVHETTIIKNGGGHPELKDLYERMLSAEKAQTLQYPFAAFEEPGLNNAITSISIVLDEYAINAMNSVRKDSNELQMYTFFTPDVAFIMTQIMYMSLAK